MLEVNVLERCGDFEQRACSIFNCAYQICTTMMLDKTPHWRWTEFRDLPRNLNHHYPEDYQVITLSLVFILLDHYSNEWQLMNSKLMGWISDFLENSHKDYGIMGNEGIQMYHEKLNNIFTTIKRGTDVCQELSHDEFAPRMLDAQAITEVEEDMKNHNTDWQRSTNDYDHNTIVNLMAMVCRTDDEKALLANAIMREAESLKQNHVVEFLESLNLKSIDELCSLANEADFALLQRLNLELRDEIEKLKGQLSDTAAKAQHAEDMLPTSDYHNSLRAELTSTQEKLKNTQAELDALINSQHLYDDQELQTNEFIIFFSNLLGFDLSPESIWQAPFARFLQEMSGGKSISQSTISRIKDQETTKKFTPKLKKDALHLLNLLMEIPKNVENGRAEILYKLIKDIYIVYGFTETDFKNLTSEKKDQFKELFEEERKQKRRESSHH